MTQSKDADLETIIINDLTKDLQSAIDNSIVIDLNNTYGATTTYLGDVGNISITGSSNDSIYIDTTTGGTYTIGGDTIDLGNIVWGWQDKNINPDEVEKMCKEYPALEKVWDKFKSMYDMCKQDFEGKKKEGDT